MNPRPNPLVRAFTEHPASVGESYLAHLCVAFGFAGTMLLTGIAVLVHGVFPFLFKRTGREAVTRLHERMVTHRVRARMPADTEAR